MVTAGSVFLQERWVINPRVWVFAQPNIGAQIKAALLLQSGSSVQGKGSWSWFYIFALWSHGPTAYNSLETLNHDYKTNRDKIKERNDNISLVTVSITTCSKNWFVLRQKISDHREILFKIGIIGEGL